MTFFRVEFRIGAEGGGGGLHGLLVARRIGAKRMLHPVAHLRQHTVGHIERVLGDKINADALGADEFHGLRDFFQKARRRIVKKQMGFIEEENQFWLFRIAHFRHFLKQLRQEPEKERGVELRRGHEPVGGEDVHVAPAIARGAHQVLDVEGGFAKEFVTALLFDHDKPALDGADGGGLSRCHIRW